MQRAERPMVDAYMTSAQRKALHDARVVLPDLVLAELEERPGGVSDADWRADPEGDLIVWCLPPHYQARYTLEFCSRFLETIRAAAAKLGATEAEWQLGEWHLLNCVAEEMAAYGIMRFADGLWATSHAPFQDAFSRVIGVVFEDTDFLHLWIPAHDGIQDSPVGRRQGIGFLNFDEWFLPFRAEVEAGT
jgi:hypothetical protein